MKVKFYSRQDEYSDKVLAELRGKLLDLGHTEVEAEADIVIAVGGDGTVLRAIRDNMGRLDKTLFAGVKTGSLGFYADFSVAKMDKLIEAINNGNPRYEEHYTLDYEICTDVYCKQGIAFNEITLINPVHTQMLEIFIDNQHFYTTRGTGICISTAGGSTGYNKSLGGAIVDTSLPVLQVTEMAAIHNNAYKTLGSPFILSPSREIMIKTKDLYQSIFTCDTESESLVGYEYIKCRLGKQKLRLLVEEQKDFTKRVKRAFL